MADKTGGLFLPATDAASLRDALSHTIVKAQEVPTPIKEDASTARLQGPDTIPEGTVFHIPWQGPDEDGDYIAIAKTDDTADRHITYAYTQDGNPATLQVPEETGTYEVRYLRYRDTKILAKATITIQASASR
jgi:Ca-activated chloride channel family protein